MTAPVNSYNRPNFPHRCGRGALWQKPCRFGPNADGTCGGTAACQPRKNNDRYVCRRRPEDGGQCELGPLPDGTCCLAQPPCRPRPTLRSFRDRLTFLAVVLTLALIGAFGSGGSLIEDSSHELRNPGQIMDMHAGATGKAGCGACHESHDKPADQFVLAAFQPSGPSNSMTNKCLDCHSFKRPAIPTSRRIARPVIPSTKAR